MIVDDDQLGLLAPAAPAEASTVKAWTKERGGGGFIYRTETRFGRIWQAHDGRWFASRRPEPYVQKDAKWESGTFKDKSSAETWVEQGGST